jgi:hypothetical protein
MPDEKEAEDLRPIPSQAEGDDPVTSGSGERPVPSQAEGEDEDIEQSLQRQKQSS